MEILRQQIFGDHGRTDEIRRWYRAMCRRLQNLNFRALGRGKFVNGMFRVTLSVVKCDHRFSSGFVYISGPEDPPKQLNLYQMDVKFVTLNRFGKLSKIPIEIWDRNRKSISLSRM